jgi:hypothetical protein
MDTTSSGRSCLDPLDRLVWGAGFRPLQSTVNNRVAEYGRPNTARVSVPVSMPGLV